MLNGFFMKKIAYLFVLCPLLASFSFAEVPYEKLVVRHDISYRVNSQTPFTGVGVEYHENGQLKEKSNFKNGLLEGPAKTYHENGQLKENLTFKNGLPDGQYERFHINGQLETVQNFSKGKIIPGVYKFFTKNGIISEEITVINDITIDYRVFSVDGWLKRKGRSINNKREGFWEEYDKNNTLKERNEYKLGEQDGQHELFHENGKLKHKGNYVTSKYSWEGAQRQGLWEFYDENGQLEAIKTYKDDKLKGYFKERRLKNGSLWWYEGEMLNGKFWGEIDKFNEEGYLVNRTQYGSEKNGTYDYAGYGYKTGWSVDYNPNGSIAKSFCYAGRTYNRRCDGVSLEDFSGVPQEKELITRDSDGEFRSFKTRPSKDDLSYTIPIYAPMPQYPRRAQARGKEGYAVIEVIITTTGGTRDPVLIEEFPKGWGFGRAALRAASKLKYNPRVVDGVAQEAPGVIYKFTFKLEQ